MEKVPAITVTPQGRKDTLKSPQRKGFRRRWVNDDPAQIQRMEEEEGYRIVHGKNSKGEEGPVTRREYILMEIPENVYSQKQAERVRQVLKSRERLNLRRRSLGEVDALSQSDEFRGVVRPIGDVAIDAPDTRASGR